MLILSINFPATSFAVPKGWTYSHLGVPTSEHNKNELYDPKWKYYTWGYDDSEFNIQMQRYDVDAPYPKLMTTYAHLAFFVPDLKKAIAGRNVIWGPIESKPGLYVAMIKDPASGMPVELLQTSLSKQQMIDKFHKPLENKAAK